MKKDLISLEKKKIRKEMLSCLRKMPREKKREASEKICELCFSLPELAQAETVLFYAPLDIEPDIFFLWKKVLSLGKKIVFPRVLPEKEVSSLELRIVKDERELASGYQGILEPAASCAKIALRDIDLVFVPCVAVDRKGIRLGHGRGFYDRLFSKGFSGTKISLVFSFQILELLPCHPHDLKCHKIISEDGPMRPLVLS